MLVECSQCGAPLDVPEGKRSVKCAYCRSTHRVQSMRTQAAHTPQGWQPPPTWTPPQHFPQQSVPHQYRASGSQARVFVLLGIVVALVGAVVPIVIIAMDTASSATDAATRGLAGAAQEQAQRRAAEAMAEAQRRAAEARGADPGQAKNAEPATRTRRPTEPDHRAARLAAARERRGSGSGRAAGDSRDEASEAEPTEEDSADEPSAEEPPSDPGPLQGPPIKRRKADDFPASLTDAVLLGTLRKHLPAIRRCADGRNEPLRMILYVKPDGDCRAAWAQSPYAGSKEGVCMQKHLNASLSFPAFDAEREVSFEWNTHL